MNSAVRPSFEVFFFFFSEKNTCGYREQCTRLKKKTTQTQTQTQAEKRYPNSTFVS